MGEASRVDEKVLAAGLYLVATPIGNLEDITLRALRVLRQADKIACEDTRQTQKLLNHFDIRTPMVSYHLFNEASRAAELVKELEAGAKVAIVSDAGTPGIADPGLKVVEAAIAAGMAVYPIPGANAAVSALVASGLGAERFTFHGFLESRGGQRRTQLQGLVRGDETHVFYETPHRILDALSDIEAEFGVEQHVVVARELTKLHEEFLRGQVREVRGKLAAREQVRGEMVLLFRLAEVDKVEQKQTVRGAIEALIKDENIPEKDALKRVAKERGMSKSEAYREMQRTKN